MPVLRVAAQKAPPALRVPVLRVPPLQVPPLQVAPLRVLVLRVPVLRVPVLRVPVLRVRVLRVRVLFQRSETRLREVPGTPWTMEPLPASAKVPLPPPDRRQMQRP